MNTSGFRCIQCNKNYTREPSYKKHMENCPKTKKDASEKGDLYMTTSNVILRPLIKWSGGKSDELETILKYIPQKFTTYIEPFVGGGALYFRLNPNKAVINDVHKELIDFYQSIKDGYINEIYQFMERHPNDETTYYNVRGLKSDASLERAKQFYYLRKTCFRGMMRYNSKGEFNIPYGKYKHCNYEDLRNPEYESLLKRTTILNEDFQQIFKKYNSKNNFMFLDPPYDSPFSDYGYCSFGRDEHRRLAECFKKTRIKCLMVIGKTDFIFDLYKDYIVYEYKKKYRFKLHSGRVGEEINTTHLVIRNFEN